MVDDGITTYPTLFYYFEGQFPTKKACVMPKLDSYELHGVTREEVQKYVDALEFVTKKEVISLSWNVKGEAYLNTSEFDKSLKVPRFSRPAPYEHWTMPIIFGDESGHNNN